MYKYINYDTFQDYNKLIHYYKVINTLLHYNELIRIM
jgi:hypothetical protein